MMQNNSNLCVTQSHQVHTVHAHLCNKPSHPNGTISHATQSRHVQTVTMQVCVCVRKPPHASNTLYSCTFKIRQLTPLTESLTTCHCGDQTCNLVTVTL